MDTNIEKKVERDLERISFQFSSKGNGICLQK